ncbi:MAG: hypothetical protein RL272_44 [Candidatus Parcubacteria bacterium]
MTVDPSEAARQEGAKRTEPADVGRGAVEFGRKAESLDDALRSFEKDAVEAERMLEKMKDPAKREEFRSALGALRGRAGGAGKALRGIVTGLALFAGGVGVGKSMGDERREAVIIDLAKKAGAAEAKRDAIALESWQKEMEAPRAAQEKGREKALDALARENAAARKENADLRKQADALMAELRSMRDERDAAERKVLAEKEKGIEMKDTLLKQQTVTANMGALFDKMRTLIGQSDDKKLKEDLERFLEAYE